MEPSRTTTPTPLGKIRDRSAALVIAGATLLLPPVAGISLTGSSIGGFPVTLAYIFAVWIILIAGAAILAKPLARADDPDATKNPGSSGS